LKKKRLGKIWHKGLATSKKRIKTRQKEISHRVRRICFVGLAYQGKDIVFTFIIEYSSLWDFGPHVIIGLFLYEDF
jgi:hypothetical protein